MVSIGKKWNFESTEDSAYTGTEYLYWQFDALPKQTKWELKTLQVQVYMQQWFHDEQGAKFMYSLTFLVWLEMALGMHSRVS